MIISSEYESKPEAVKKTTDRPLKISAGKIKIIDLNDGTFKKSEIEEKLHQSAELVSQAFKEEKITNLMYDLSRPENLRTWRRLNEYSAEKLYQAGENSRDIYQHLGYQLIDQKENADLTVYHMFKMIE